MSVRTIRQRLSRRLLASGARLALDRRAMCARAYASGVRSLSSGDLQVLSALDLVSTVQIRLGMLVMPKRVADPSVIGHR